MGSLVLMLRPVWPPLVSARHRACCAVEPLSVSVSEVRTEGSSSSGARTPRTPGFATPLPSVGALPPSGVHRPHGRSPLLCQGSSMLPQHSLQAGMNLCTSDGGSCIIGGRLSASAKRVAARAWVAPEQFSHTGAKDLGAKLFRSPRT